VNIVRTPSAMLIATTCDEFRPAKDAPFGLRAETATNRDEKYPGTRVIQAMTRDAYIVSKSDDIRVRHLPVVNRAKRLSAFCRLETCRLETSRRSPVMGHWRSIEQALTSM
jgi:hypothetical protein